MALVYEKISKEQRKGRVRYNENCEDEAWRN